MLKDRIHASIEDVAFIWREWANADYFVHCKILLYRFGNFCQHVLKNFKSFLFGKYLARYFCTGFLNQLTCDPKKKKKLLLVTYIVTLFFDFCEINYFYRML